MPTKLVEAGERFEPSDPYVRRFWVAAVGPSAVAELLRLVRGASQGEEVRLPRHLPLFLRTGLVWVCHGHLMVADTLPEVPREMRWRFPPGLTAEHNRLIGESD